MGKTNLPRDLTRSWILPSEGDSKICSHQLAGVMATRDVPSKLVDSFPLLLAGNLSFVINNFSTKNGAEVDLWLIEQDAESRAIKRVLKVATMALKDERSAATVLSTGAEEPALV